MPTEQQVVYGVGKAGVGRSKPPVDTSVPLQLTAERLRVWGGQAAFSLLDQGFASGASFGLNLLLARWLPAEAYGAFAVAFVGYMFVYGLYNVLLLEPMSVHGASRHTDSLPIYFRHQLTIHGVLVSPLAGIVLLAGILVRQFTPASPLAGALIGFGVALPFLLLLWLARRICYAMQRPSLAAGGSTLYLGFVGAGVIVLHRYGELEPFAAFVLMGTGSFLAGVFLIMRFGLLQRRSLKDPGVLWGRVLRENWNYGRWLVGSTVLSSVVSQTQVLFVSGILGLGSAGILRAMQLPALLMTQVSTATGFLVLPSFSYDFVAGALKRMRHKAILVSIALSVSALILVGVTWAFSGVIERILFSGKYASYSWLMPMLVLFTVAFGPMQGFGMALRAIRKPQFDLVSGLFAAPVAMLCAHFGTRWWGLAGAALSLILGFAVQGLVTAFYFRRLVSDVEIPGGACT